MHYSINYGSIIDTNNHLNDIGDILFFENYSSDTLSLVGA